VLEGQSEDDVYANATPGSPEFEEFLLFLGDKIKLKGWEKYRGGLDIKSDTTGTHSVYTAFQDNEIMFHVAPLLPWLPNDKQQLERKRHLGNDIIVLLFKESQSPFNPTLLRSEFNHIFVVISASKSGGKTYYKMEIACKEGMPPFGPALPHPSIFEKGPQFREFLLTKLINGERAALHGCPSFRNKYVSVRRTTLDNLQKNYGPKK